MAGSPLPPLDPISPCEWLSFEAHLQSINQAVFQGLYPELELDIVAEERKLVAKTPLGGTVGSIIEKVAQLKSCIEQGYSFQGRVLTFGANDVTILVHIRKS